MPNISQALSGPAGRPPDHGYLATTRHVDCEHLKCAADTLTYTHALIHIRPVSFSILVDHGDNAILAWSEKEDLLNFALMPGALTKSILALNMP